MCPDEVRATSFTAVRPGLPWVRWEIGRIDFEELYKWSVIRLFRISVFRFQRWDEDE
jgi:hypothetical protein